MSTIVSRLLTLLALLTTVLAATAACAQTAGGKVTVLVLPFEVNADPELDYLKDSLPELLGDRLVQDGFDVLPQETVRQLIEEHDIEYLDLSTAKDLALLARAAYAVYGSFNQLGETISLDVRLVEAQGVKTPKPLFVVQEGLINAVPAIEDLAEKIRLELMSKERIEAIDVEGNRFLDKDVVLMRLRHVRKGEIYDPKVVNEELKNVFDLGYFDDVQVRVDDLPEGVKVTFVVDEKPRISVVDVLGTDALDKDDLISLMNTKTGAVLNPKVLADDLGKIKEEYRKEGYYKAQITHEVAASDEGQARLNILVEEGDKLYIRKISINGAEQMDPDDLRSELALGERGMFSWITGSGVLKEEYLNRDAAALEAYYANHGFIEAQVGQPKVEFEDDGIYVTFEVKEGNRFKVGAVTYSGDMLEPAEKLNEIIKTDDLGSEGDYLDRSVLRSDSQALSEYYSNYGYAFAEANYLIHPDPETLTADIEFQMSKRQKVYIRRVTIQGNTRTRDNVIRRKVLLSDGDLFSGEDLAYSTRNLNNLGYFDQADIETIPTADEGLMDLKVKVREKSTGELSAGAGYSSSSGVYFVATVKENNLFGKGYQGSLEGAWGGDYKRYILRFTNPNFRDTPWLVGGDLYHYDDDYDDYDRVSTGARARFGHPLGKFSYTNLQYRLERYEITNVDEDAADEILDIKGSNWVSAVYGDIVRNTLDRYLNPSKGMKSSLSMEYAGGLMLGDDEFIKYIADHNYYRPLWFDHIFHFHGQLGYVMENFGGKDIPVYERFYLGGINNARGYKKRYISPRDEESGDRIGGNKMAFVNFEYLFPILEEMGIMGVTFFDAGQVWDDGEAVDFDPKKSVGIGIRWYSALGPLRLEYGYALDSIQEQGSKGKLEFTIGQFF